MSSKSRFSEDGNSFQRNLGRGRRRTNSDDVSTNKGFVTTLILAPTRELALQISGVIEELVEAMPSSGKEKDNIDVCVVTGGVPMEPQIEMFAERKLNNRNVHDKVRFGIELTSVVCLLFGYISIQILLK